MQTNAQEIPAETGVEKPEYDLARWRADAQVLAEEIRANKRTMRAGFKGARALATSDPEWLTASALSSQQSAAQTAAHYFADRATALYIFRASLRDREHIPGFDPKRRAWIIEKLSKEYLRK